MSDKDMRSRSALPEFATEQVGSAATHTGLDGLPSKRSQGAESSQDELNADGGGADLESDHLLDDEGVPDGNDPPEAIRNRHVKRLSDEAARHRVAARVAEEARQQEADRADAAERVALEAKAEVAFVKAAGPLFVDVDAAWKLIDRAGLRFDEDGAVVAVDALVQMVADRYPYLLAEYHQQAEATHALPVSPSGRPPARRKASDGLDRAALEARFPALRRHRGW